MEDDRKVSVGAVTGGVIGLSLSAYLFNGGLSPTAVVGAVGAVALIGALVGALLAVLDRVAIATNAAATLVGGLVFAYGGGLIGGLVGSLNHTAVPVDGRVTLVGVYVGAVCLGDKNTRERIILGAFLGALLGALFGGFVGASVFTCAHVGCLTGAPVLLGAQLVENAFRSAGNSAFAYIGALLGVLVGAFGYVAVAIDGTTTLVAVFAGLSCFGDKATCGHILLGSLLGALLSALIGQPALVSSPAGALAAVGAVRATVGTQAPPWDLGGSLAGGLVGAILGGVAVDGAAALAGVYVGAACLGDEATGAGVYLGASVGGLLGVLIGAPALVGVAAVRGVMGADAPVCVLGGALLGALPQAAAELEAQTVVNATVILGDLLGGFVGALVFAVSATELSENSSFELVDIFELFILTVGIISLPGAYVGFVIGALVGAVSFVGVFGTVVTLIGVVIGAVLVRPEVAVEKVILFISLCC